MSLLSFPRPAHPLVPLKKIGFLSYLVDNVPPLPSPAFSRAAVFKRECPFYTRFALARPRLKPHLPPLFNRYCDVIQQIMSAFFLTRHKRLALLRKRCNLSSSRFSFSQRTLPRHHPVDPSPFSSRSVLTLFSLFLLTPEGKLEFLPVTVPQCFPAHWFSSLSQDSLHEFFFLTVLGSLLGVCHIPVPLVHKNSPPISPRCDFVLALCAINRAMIPFFLFYVRVTGPGVDVRSLSSFKAFPRVKRVGALNVSKLAKFRCYIFRKVGFYWTAPFPDISILFLFLLFRVDLKLIRLTFEIPNGPKLEFRLRPFCYLFQAPPSRLQSRIGYVPSSKFFSSRNPEPRAPPHCPNINRDPEFKLFFLPFVPTG